jgi:hypothetical protein
MTIHQIRATTPKPPKPAKPLAVTIEQDDALTITVAPAPATVHPFPTKP